MAEVITIFHFSSTSRTRQKPYAFSVTTSSNKYGSVYFRAPSEILKELFVYTSEHFTREILKQLMVMCGH